ncbi:MULTISPECIES: molybdate ABC transporter substrate-binding protein [Acinetobacter]|uniref:Molybdate ABC transporter, periplasmic molybdate-binding protein n=2 Tax=Acinetobacter TaxID=469 RepID=N8W342_9GAMM|nr:MULTISPECIES: molybdate ABC transporter substrate-binding protein [Acinetobacter]ENU91263.1 molybdate ABC transporter, periplasmic molybdate-binding protein [Acinetobacter vivianii]ENW97177.1 molybdate ABC transporter, periplasmic molybdate-binding protein [Acinetobacter dispersus]
MKRVLLSLGMCVMSHGHAQDQDNVTVYAAASLTNVLAEINQQYKKQNNINIKTSYAGSSTLAKQIEAGAPANLFISADVQWMNYLQNKKIINGNDRINLLGNRLVLISPKDRVYHFQMNKSFDPLKAFNGKICTGNTLSVPVGKYAKQALTNLNWWAKLKPSLVETEDVRAALNFVMQRECSVGIVYATDALITNKVSVIAEFPKSTYSPIIYPMGIVNKNAATIKYYQYLQSDEAEAIFKKFGFSILNNT